MVATEGIQAEWDGSVTLAQGSDGLPTEIHWDYDDDGVVDDYVCGGYAVSCVEHCSRSNVLGDDEVLSIYGSNAILDTDVADLDADGRDDVVFTGDDYYGGAFWQVLLGSGARLSGGTFAAAAQAAVGDVTGDGIPDLVLSATDGYYQNGELTILAGDGTGNFSYFEAVSFGSRSSAVALGDLDGDGVLEIASDDVHTEIVGGFLVEVSGVVIHRFDGNSFVASAVATGSFEAQSIAFGDVGGDGNVDVVTFSGNGGQTVRIYRGDGTGALADTTESIGIAVPFQAYTSVMDASDIDGDSKLDVVIATSDPSSFENYSNTQVVFLRGSGTTFAAPVAFPFVGRHFTIQLADADGDLDEDAVLGLPDAIFMLRNDGAGVFTSIGLSGNLHRSYTAVADLDDDGFGDLAGSGGSGAWALYGSGAGIGRPRTPVLGAPSSLTRGHLNGDAHLDLVSGSLTGTSVLLGDGTGAFTRTDLALPSLSLAVGELDAGATPDLVAGSASSLKVLLGDGSGGFTESASIAEAAHAVAIGDFDEDGAGDVVYANANGLFLRESDGAGGLLASTQVYDYSGGEGCDQDTCTIAVADFSRDGNLDIAFAFRTAAPFAFQQVRLFAGNGAGGFPVGATLTGPSAIASRFRLTVGNFTGDAEPDLALLARTPVATSGSSTTDPADLVYLYANVTGQATPIVLSEAMSVTSGEPLAAIVLDDVNGDGRADLVSAGGWLTVHDATGPYYAPFQYGDKLVRSSGTRPQAIATGDFDGDGWNDIASANGSGDVTFVAGTAPNWSCDIDGYHTFENEGPATAALDVITDTGTVRTDFPVDVVDAVPYLYSVSFYGPGYGPIEERTDAFFAFYPYPNYYDWITRCEIDFGDGALVELEPCDAQTLTHVFPDGDPTDVPVSITLYDEDGSATESYLVTVHNLGPLLQLATPASTTEGVATLAEVTISDSDDGDWLVEWDFDYDGVFVADSSASVATIGDYGISRTFDEGVHVIAVRVTDQPGDPESAATLVTAEVVVDDSTPAPGVLIALGPLLEATPVTLSLPVTASPLDTIQSCTWNFGDGTPDEVDPGCAGLVGGTTSRVHTFPDADPTMFTVTVLVEDEDETLENVTEITVLNAAPQTTAAPVAPPVPTEGDAVTVDVTIAESVNVNDAPYRIEWQWGDGTTETSVASATGTASRSHTYRDDGIYAFSARVIDQTDSFGTTGPGSAEAVAGAAVTVANADPVLAAVPTQDAIEGSLFLLALSATDPGESDARTFSLSNGPSGLALLPNGTVAWVPTYSQAGGGAGQSHSVFVSVADGDGGSDAGTFTVRVRWKDEDADGMADTWEIAHGMDPTVDDSLGDVDGDGIVNVNEFNGAGPFVPNTVELSSPIGGAAVTSADPSLVVSNTTDPDSSSLIYAFEIFSDETLTTSILQASVVGGTNGTTVLVVDDVLSDAGADDDDPANAANVDLEDDHTYWWRARAFDGTYFGPWSAAGHFDHQPVDDTPGAPSIAAPLPASHVSTTSPALVVGNAADPDDAPLSYRFRVFSDAALTVELRDSGAVAEGSFGTTAWVVSPALADDTTYWWSARASDGSTESVVASASLTVNLGNNEPSAPPIVGPVDGAILAATSATLEASAATDPDPGQTLQYVFELDVSPTFNTAAAQSSGLQAGTTWDAANLLEDTVYWWRVRAFDGLASGDWTLASFRVNAVNGAPGSPVPLGPVDGALVDDTTPSLRAQHALDPEDDDLTYSFTVRAGSVDGEIVASGSIPQASGPEAIFTVAEELERGAVYVWTVTAVDTAGLESEPSAAATFTVFDANVGSGGGGGGGGCSVDMRPASALGSMLTVALLLAIRRRREGARISPSAARST